MKKIQNYAYMPPALLEKGKQGSLITLDKCFPCSEICVSFFKGMPGDTL